MNFQIHIISDLKLILARYYKNLNGDNLNVIIDAANVAFYHKGENSKAKLNNIILAVRALEKENHNFLIIADASLRHSIDDKETYLKLVNDDIIDEVPVGTIADHYILTLAEEENAKILSNDKFRDFSSEFPDIQSMRISFSIENNNFILGKAKKPKKVKNLLQNICDETLNELERKRWSVYKGKETTKFTPLNVANSLCSIRSWKWLMMLRHQFHMSSSCLFTQRTIRQLSRMQVTFQLQLPTD